MRLNPSYYFANLNAMAALFFAGRPAEAKQLHQRAATRGMNVGTIALMAAYVALANDDAPALARVSQALHGTADEGDLLYGQAEMALPNDEREGGHDAQ